MNDLRFFDRLGLSGIRLFFRFLGRGNLADCRRRGARIGRLLHAVSRRYRRICQDNLALAYPASSSAWRADLCRRVYENLGRTITEMAWARQRTPAELDRYFHFEGRRHIDQAVAGGKGVLALTGHFGNWELTSVSAHQLGHALSVIYRPLDYRPLEILVTENRERFGARMIPKKKSFRKILKKMKQGHIITLLMDQNVAMREGVFADFFGHPACTNRGMALLALATKAPVVPGFLIRVDNGFVMKFDPPLPLIDTGDRIRDIEENTRQYNEAIEQVVRRYPDQWFWVHRRWNTKTHYPWPRVWRKKGNAEKNKPPAGGFRHSSRKKEAVLRFLRQCFFVIIPVFMVFSFAAPAVRADSRGSIQLSDLKHGSGKVGTFRALVIGINKYADPHIRDLKTAVNDARSVARVLQSRYNFKTRLLLNLPKHPAVCIRAGNPCLDRPGHRQ